MKNRWNRQDINRPRPRHRQTHTIYKMYLNMMLVICIKEHLSIVWSTIHEKLSNSKAEFKKVLLIK